MPVSCHLVANFALPNQLTMIRFFTLAFFICPLCSTFAQPTEKAEKIVIITLDGMRWQEIFSGMDEQLVNNPEYNQDSRQRLQEQYGASTPGERRVKLMPFLWSTIANEGQIYGNRLLGNQVDNANPYWFSYPGYSEIFTGNVDSAINSNDYPPNPNGNVLAFLQKQPDLNGKVAAFGAWDAFDRILNEKDSGFPVVCGSEPCGGTHPTPREQMLNDLKRDAYAPFGASERLDVFTHYAAFEYLKDKHPNVLYISYGETDEWAHHGHYRDYLDAAHQTDQWIADIWHWIQSDADYQDKTALLITTDHGRGDLDKNQWTSHGQSVPDSHEIWFAILGPGVPGLGEIRQPAQRYQKQFAQTIAEWLGYHFQSNHSVAPGIWTSIKP